MKSKIGLAVVSCLLILAATACKSNQISEADEIKANQERAQPILQAIGAYEKDHGQWPESLDLLTPTYLAEIPKT